MANCKKRKILNNLVSVDEVGELPILTDMEFSLYLFYLEKSTSARKVCIKRQVEGNKQPNLGQEQKVDRLTYEILDRGQIGSSSSPAMQKLSAERQ